MALDYISGEVLLVNKPLDWTSFDVVNKIKYAIGKKKTKVGHAGTLDPLATGLLIVCTGKYTKQIQGIQDADKEYIAEITLGHTTPSYDLETEFDAEFPTSHISNEMLEEVLQEFIGTIEQFPPIFSAIKVKGQRAYNAARKGEQIELKSRSIRINEIEILSFETPVIRLRISCSKGTYIRSLAHDLGKALNSGAHLSGLVRTKIGDYSLDTAKSIEDLVAEIKD